MPKYLHALDTLTDEVISIKDITKENKDSFNLICEDCKCELIPKLGNILEHHFAHKSDYVTCSSNGESLEHRYAKEQLCKFLNEKGIILSLLRCCNTITKILIGEKYKAIVEKQIIDGRADIGIVSIISNEVVYVIEIMKTNKTEKRYNCWSEFKAIEVIEQLSKKENTICLNNIKHCPCYEDKLIAEKKRIEEINEKNQIEEKRRINEINERKLIEQKNIQEIKTEMLKIAKDLGYLGMTNTWDDQSRRITILSLTNPVYQFDEKWYIRLGHRSSDWYKLADYFVSKRRCLKCLISHNTEKYKPYCDSCYITIRNDDKERNYKEISLDKNKIRKIKSYFSWINDIPQSNTPKGICIGCHKQVNFIWFYGNRSICINCVKIRHHREYPFGIYLTSLDDNLDNILKSYTLIPSLKI